MSWLLVLIWGCGFGEISEPEGAPPRVTPQSFAPARAWVRDVAVDDTHVYWANYDVSTGRSARAVIDRAPLAGGDREEIVEERHPPDDLAVHDGFLYWSFQPGTLKRIPVAGGERQILTEHGPACFAVDNGGVYYIREVKLYHLDPDSKTETVLADKVLGDCPVPLGDQIYWTERKAIRSVSRAGGEPTVFAEVKKPKGLVVYDDHLYTCLDDILTRFDPQSGEAELIRSYCKPEGLAVSDDGHWFLKPYFEGWPPQERIHLVEVTKDGPSWLFDGEGISEPAVHDTTLVWFGKPMKTDWKGYHAPVPEAR